MHFQDSNSSERAELVDISSIVQEIAAELPIIRPIQEFIHLNLLLRYQTQPFWKALRRVSNQFEAMPLPAPEYFRNLLYSGALPVERLRSRLQGEFSGRADEILRDLIEGDLPHFEQHDKRKGPLHQQWNHRLGVNISELADGMLLKWLSAFMDQGVGSWQMPGADSLSFFEAIASLINQAWMPPAPCRHLRILLAERPLAVIERALQFLCPDRCAWPNYLRESIYTLRGWAGLVHSINANPELLPFSRRISLLEFLAVKLALEHAWILHSDPSIVSSPLKVFDPVSTSGLISPDWFAILKACQETYESVTHDRILSSLKQRGGDPVSAPSYQLVMCMDDRECSLRRHLEGLNAGIETFGTAGHFGVECLYQHDDEAFARKHCPALIPPMFFISEPHQPCEPKSQSFLSAVVSCKVDPLSELFYSFFQSFRATLELTRNLFFPLAGQNLENVRNVTVSQPLALNYSSEVAPISGVQVGLTPQQMASIVGQQLRIIGLTSNFAPLVFIMGHESTSVNNPYIAAYGCGACSGRSGAVNARAFAQMANDLTVRSIVAQQFAIEIPPSTRFVPALHDTCQDVVTFYEEKGVLGVSDACQLRRFKRYLSLALYKNAQERARTFKRLSYGVQGKDAQKEVLRRARSLFETRPELGHTNVAFAIVAPRAVTRKINLGRRSFLQSYDRSIDPSGEILTQILSAVIPVCSGISLDYFFSRVDNLRFGAGSKLPQNVVGNLGVSHGTESDLLCGLPFQMIDQHQPVRLMIVVDQQPEVALKAVMRQPQLLSVVENGWVHYVCFDSLTGSVTRYQSGSMQRYEMGGAYAD